MEEVGVTESTEAATLRQPDRAASHIGDVFGPRPHLGRPPPLASAAEVSGHLVGSTAFKAAGTGDPRPAGSIPVHLRQSVHGRPPRSAEIALTRVFVPSRRWAFVDVRGALLSGLLICTPWVPGPATDRERARGPVGRASPSGSFASLGAGYGTCDMGGIRRRGTDRRAGVRAVARWIVERPGEGARAAVRSPVRRGGRRGPCRSASSTRRRAGSCRSRSGPRYRPGCDAANQPEPGAGTQVGCG